MSSMYTTPSERTAPTPPSTSSTSHRRSSLSSVVSSGRRRTDQSLLDVAVSLVQGTPVRSQQNGPTRSRQLDFGGGDTDDVDEETQLASEEPLEVLKQETVEVDAEEAPGGERQQPEAEEDVGTAPARPRRTEARGRRRKVFWTADEEEFLRHGVAKYGVGKWKKILMDSQGVFSPHRTNVDLKDKWKDFHKPRHTSGKRRKEAGATTPLQEDVTANEGRSSARVVPVKTRRVIPDDTSEVSSSESTDTRRRRQAAVVVERAAAQIATEDTETQRGAVELKFATQKSFPEFDDVAVNVESCRDVFTLKECLRSSVLSHAPAHAEVEFIGLKSRTLYNDDAALSRCIQDNGLEFFLVVHDESREEFV